MLIVCLLVVVGLFSPVWGGEVRPITFLHALQEQGYGDVAVDYLNMLKQSDDLPKELRETWDLEMSKSLRSAAQNAYNAEDSESLMLEAEKSLAKFLEEKPNNPQAFEARALLANFSMDKALKDFARRKAAAVRKNQGPNFSTTPGPPCRRPAGVSNRPRKNIKPNWMQCNLLRNGR